MLPIRNAILASFHIAWFIIPARIIRGDDKHLVDKLWTINFKFNLVHSSSLKVVIFSVGVVYDTP